MRFRLHGIDFTETAFQDFCRLRGRRLIYVAREEISDNVKRFARFRFRRRQDSSTLAIWGRPGGSYADHSSAHGLRLDFCSKAKQPAAAFRCWIVVGRWLPLEPEQS
jgi:hypothetical protein